MGQDTKIEWAHHTFNPWEGCEKVSAACKNCYAETRAVRFGHSKSGKHLPLWGPGSRRQFRSDAYWKQPLRWNREAEAAGERRRVFCMSLGDFFEWLPGAHPDLLPLSEARDTVLALIDATPHLDWLLLTKRPQNITRIFPGWAEGGCSGFRPIPKNVWLGVTVEDQETADERIPKLLKVPATVHFLSCEPLLGPVDLKRVIWRASPYGHVDVLRGGAWSGTNWGFVNHSDMETVDWVIAGGESGVGARPSDPDWFRSLRDQCAELGANVPFLFKQWGAWVDVENMPPETYMDFDAAGSHLIDGRGPVRVGKERSGRLLDGAEHTGFPGREMVDEIRPAVMWFARQMELKLRTHDADRGPHGWRGEKYPIRMFERLEDEVEELRRHADGGDPKRRIEEATDVANFAMMCADLAREELKGA